MKKTTQNKLVFGNLPTITPAPPAAPETPQPRRAPQPPVAPALEDCCLSGCAPCVFDLYDAALQRYREELKAWQERQRAAGAPD